MKTPIVPASSFFFRATLELPILPDNDESYFHPGRSQTQRNDGI